MNGGFFSIQIVLRKPEAGPDPGACREKTDGVSVFVLEKGEHNDCNGIIIYSIYFKLYSGRNRHLPGKAGRGGNLGMAFGAAFYAGYRVYYLFSFRAEPEPPEDF
jgi:hypothetical protein